MSNKKRIVVAFMMLILVEFIYFASVGIFTSLFKLPVSLLVVQVIGVIIAIAYTIIIDTWLRSYRKVINYRIGKIEQEQNKLKKRVAKLERVIKSEVDES